MSYLRLLAGALILTLLLIMGAACTMIDKAEQLKEYSRENCLMNTLLSIRLFSSDAELAQKALDEAFAEFHRIEILADSFAEEKPESSDVCRINKNAGIKPVKVSEDTLTMLEKSLAMSELSAGAFDITVGVLRDLWGFGQRECRIPADEELENGLAFVGYKQIVVDRVQKSVFLPQQGMKIDLGGIAKGYAIDRAVEKLQQMGIESAIINAGGSIYALGGRPDGEPWCIGIQDPRDEKNLIALLKIKDRAVVSSGDYERYFIENGVRYHHILDPATGKPARKLISSTVVAQSATDADLLSTALFVLGTDSGLELIENFPGSSTVFIDSRGEISLSEELTDKVEFTDGGDYKVRGEV